MDLNNKGWVATKFCLFIILLVSILSATLGFHLLLNQEIKTDTLCREQLNHVMHQTRSSIKQIQHFNPLAENLYQLQESLKPFIWIPKVAALYNKILTLRKKMDLLQNLVIKALNLKLKLDAYKLYFALQKSYKEIKSSYHYYYYVNYFVIPPASFQMAIKKKQNILFPSYILDTNFSKAQELKISIKVNLQSTSKNFISESFSQNKYCHGSLKEVSDQKLEIIYLKKSNSLTQW